MDTTPTTGLDPTAERLASEIADVRASIALVSSGVASNITLTGLRFSQQLAESLAEAAARQGVHLEASFWPDDDLGDLHIGRAGDRAAGNPEKAATDD
jgi:hypothetical protein